MNQKEAEEGEGTFPHFGNLLQIIFAIWSLEEFLSFGHPIYNLYNIHTDVTSQMSKDNSFFQYMTPKVFGARQATAANNI